MTVRAMVLVAVVLQVALAPALSAQDAAGFAGEWIAKNETKGITSVKIVDAPSGRTVQAFGACTPKPCDWGIVPFTVLEQRPKGSGPAVGLATWRRGTATRVMTFKLGEGSILIEVFNLFSGAKDQPSYFTAAELYGRSKASARLPTPATKQ